jgi:hypothetical protein
MQRLIHELEIHQTELKMQNEELRIPGRKLKSNIAMAFTIYMFRVTPFREEGRSTAQSRKVSRHAHP